MPDIEEDLEIIDNLDVAAEEEPYKNVIPDNLIKKSIRKCYLKRTRLPAILLILLTVMWFIFPFSDIAFPLPIDDTDDLATVYNERSTCVSTTLNKLYFTGYTSSVFSRPNGYYYYTVRDGCILIVLLSPSTCSEGLPNIESVTIKARITKPSKSYDQLLFNLSSDLSQVGGDLSAISSDLTLTTKGFLSLMEVVYLDEVAINGISTYILMFLYIACAIYTLISFLTNLSYAIFPRIAPPVRRLSRFGNPITLLDKAEHELSTLPQLATEDMYITESFFIELSNEGVALVPINEIIWVYKHSTLHKFLWYDFVISYTLHIHGNKHFYLRCPKNIKSDIDGIMDYLAEANHNILVGFNEENRIKAQQLQNKGFIHFEGLFELMKKHI